MRIKVQLRAGDADAFSATSIHQDGTHDIQLAGKRIGAITGVDITEDGAYVVFDLDLDDDLVTLEP